MKRFFGFLLIVLLVAAGLKFLAWWRAGKKEPLVILRPETVFVPKPEKLPSPARPPLPEKDLPSPEVSELSNPAPPSSAEESSPLKDPSKAPGQTSTPAARPEKTALQKAVHPSDVAGEETSEAEKNATAQPRKNAPSEKTSALQKDGFTKEQNDSEWPSFSGKGESSNRKLLEIRVGDSLFVTLEEAQGATDERTDAERRLQKGGAYGWGILEDYEDPDRPVEVLGGILLAKHKATGEFYFLKPAFPGASVRRITDPSSVFGPLGLKAHGEDKKQLLEEALRAGTLPGTPEDYELWFLFPRREALYIQNKVVRAFECAIRELGLTDEEASDFRREARLRFEVVALRRPNGGILGCLLPRYFRWESEEIPFPQKCLQEDPEWQKIKDLLPGGKES